MLYQGRFNVFIQLTICFRRLFVQLLLYIKQLVKMQYITLLRKKRSFDFCRQRQLEAVCNKNLLDLGSFPGVLRHSLFFLCLSFGGSFTIVSFNCSVTRCRLVSKTVCYQFILFFFKKRLQTQSKFFNQSLCYHFHHVSLDGRYSLLFIQKLIAT